MAIGMIARIKIQEGKNDEFEAVFKKLEAAGAENEDGCNFYSCHRTEDPNVYVVLEQYKDGDAMAAHGKSDHFRTFGREMGAFMDGRPDLEQLTSIS